jgi:hypothetical protein
MSPRSDSLPSVPTALKELNPQQSLFLAALLELGGGPQHGAEAALTAGYADTHQDAERAARILLSSPKIMSALKNAVAKRFDAAAAAAFNTLLEICTNKSAPASARNTAAMEILNRSLGPVPSRSMAITAKVTTIEDLIFACDAQEKAKEAAGEVLDVEYTDTTPTMPRADEDDGEE